MVVITETITVIRHILQQQKHSHSHSHANRTVGRQDSNALHPHLDSGDTGADIDNGFGCDISISISGRSKSDNGSTSSSKKQITRILHLLVRLLLGADSDASNGDYSDDGSTGGNNSSRSSSGTTGMNFSSAIKGDSARANIIWLIGDFNEHIPDISPDILRILCVTFATEGPETRMQILNFATKIAVKMPAVPIIQTMTQVCDL